MNRIGPRDRAHEVTHSINFKRPSGGPARGWSIMRGETIPSADELHGRILYKRPCGSLTPDRDPPRLTIN